MRPTPISAVQCCRTRAVSIRCGDSIRRGTDRLLQRSRPGTEPRIEHYWRLAGVADGALDFLEIARREIVPLLQVEALICGCRGYRFELVVEPSDKIGEFTLPVPHLPQARDQIGAFAIRLFQHSAKGKGETMGAI